MFSSQNLHIVALFLSLLFISAVVSSPSLPLSSLNTAEWDAFIDLYNSMGGPTWLNYYNTSTDPCHYVMVRCDPTGSTITRINLRSNNLTGTIPPSIGSFPNAARINLAGNHLQGEIPNSFAQLSSVELVDLSDNQLSGPVPESFGQLKSLKELYIYSNKLTSLPNSITNLLNLTLLQANDNELTGNLFPLSSAMKVVFLELNHFTGVIPDFPQGAMLETYSISGNSITGTIPETIRNAQKLIHFFATDNKITGTLPSALTQLPQLEMLYGANNLFYDVLPEFSSSLRYISLGYNQFHGSIPRSLVLLPNTSFVDMTVNHLNGTVPQEIVNFHKFNFSCNFISSPLCPTCGPCELCGDGFCDSLGFENCATCPQDCGQAPCGICGDGFCQTNASETCSSCFRDCGVCAPPANKKCPGNPECTGRGTCSRDTLICDCREGFSGPACESATTPVVVEPKPDNPTTDISGSSGKVFQVNVQQLVEYDVNSAVVRRVNLTSVPLNLTESESVDSDLVSFHNWTYFGSIPGFGSSEIIVTIVFYRNDTSIEFANQTIDLAAQTTKYTLTVRNWPFASVRNTLGITFGAGVGDKVCVQSQNDTAGNVQWIKLIVPSGEALYAQFMDLVVLDTKIVHASFTSRQTGSVELIVPHFWDEVTFDPNFSLLVTDLHSSASECFRKEPFASWKIAMAIVVTVLGAIAIVLLSIYAHRRLRQSRLVKEARNAHNIMGPSSVLEMSSTAHSVNAGPHEPQIEKMNDMVVHTSAGTFVVQL